MAKKSGHCTEAGCVLWSWLDKNVFIKLKVRLSSTENNWVCDLHTCISPIHVGQ